MGITNRLDFQQYRIEPKSGTKAARTYTSDTSLAATLDSFGFKMIKSFTSDDDRETFVFEGDLSNSCENFYNGNPEFSKFAFTHKAFARKRELISEIYKKWDSLGKNPNKRI